MSKEEFVKLWGDELRGLCVAAFAAEERTRGSFAEKGNFMVEQLVRCKGLLERMYDSMKAKPPKTA